MPDYTLDASFAGDELWQHSHHDDSTRHLAYDASESVVVSQSSVDYVLIGAAASDGAKLWETSVEEGAIKTPLAASDGVVFRQQDDSVGDPLLAYDVTDGTQLYQITHPGEGNIITALVATSEAVYTVGRERFDTGFDGVVAYDRTGQSVSWDTALTGIDDKLAVTDGVVVAGTGTDSRLVGLDTADGSVLWDRTYDDRVTIGPGNAVGASGTVAVQTYNDGVLVIDAATGDVNYVTSGSLGRTVTYHADADAFVAGTDDGEFSAVERQTGASLYTDVQFPYDDEPFGITTDGGDRLFLVSDNFDIPVYAATVGRAELPAFEITGLTTNSPVDATGSGDVEATVDIENTGDLTGEQTVELTIPQSSAAASVSLAGDATTTVMLAAEAVDADEQTATVTTDDDTATATVEVVDSDLLVEITDTNSPVDAGEELLVTVDLDNTGGLNLDDDLVLELEET